MENRGNARRTALRYAELGYPVFPCAPGTKTPLTAHGHLDATTDPDQIETWWSGRPHANVAIATAGLVVIDVDADSTWLADAPDRAMELAVAPLSLTANDGRHYIFRQPAGKAWRSTTAALAKHVDTRADGGYIVVPPSVLAGGKAYRWAEGMALDDPPENLPEPPPWLAGELDRLAMCGPTLPCVAAGPSEANPIPSGQRNATLARLAGTMRRGGMSQSEILAALERANSERCQPPLNGREVGRIASSVARYPPDEVSVALVENHFAQDFGTEETENVERDDVPALADPGPIPDELLRVPGFINEVMDYCVENAPTRNPAMAFCGALALQSFLGGRKVRDQADNRTNLYLLALAPTGSGKDYPRKINKIVLSHIGRGDASVLRFASGEAIEDKLAQTPCLLCQTDEIDGMLLQIKGARDGRYESLMDRLKEIYTSSDQSITTRCLAKTQSVEVHQPSLTLLGTAVPTHYYSALSEKMLTDGFFSRTICVEATSQIEDQDPRIIELPDRVLETATWWSRFHPTPGNLAHHNPSPAIVPMTDEARTLLREVRQLAREQQDQANANGRVVDSAIWSRVRQMTHKLALIHAISNNHRTPQINAPSVTWARDFTLHQARRMLFMASGHVSDGEFDADCKKAIRILTEWRNKHGPDAVIVPWRFRQRMNLHPQKFKDVMFELEQCQQAHLVTIPGKTKPSLGYKLK